MKMEYWIMNSDHNLWNIVLHGNSRKRTGRDPRGNIMILPPVTMEEQIAVQRETKARTILLQSLPEDHMADFHHLDDAKDIWLAVKARIPAAPTHSAFISAASTNSKWSTADSKCQPSSVSYTTTSSSAGASGNVLENVLHSFFAESDPQQQITYEDFDQISKLDLEELDIKWQMAMLSVRINRFKKKAGKKMDSKTRYSTFKIKELDKSEEPKALVSVDSMLNWSDHESEDMEKGASKVYGMIAGYGDDAVIPAVDGADGVSTDGIFADGVFVAAGVGADGVSVTSSDATDAET
ncbi:hypothetical protein Tco_1416436 [Tanacetum coccineum]